MMLAEKGDLPKEYPTGELSPTRFFTGTYTKAVNTGINGSLSTAGMQALTPRKFRVAEVAKRMPALAKMANEPALFENADEQ